MNHEQSPLRDLRVAAFESRRTAELVGLIQKTGATPMVSPSMREVPLGDSPDVLDFAKQLITGQIDVVILTTGVGFQHLLTSIERHLDRQRFLDSLGDVVTIARGPKSTAALRAVGIAPTHQVPEPNTWRQVLATLDQQAPVMNQRVAIQEYGIPNASLVAGLEARGAQVLSVKVYDWALPEDTRPLEENVRAIAAGDVDIVLFTSAYQIHNVMLVAQQLGVEARLRAQILRMVVGSVGPSTSQMLQEHSVPIDIEPVHPRMGQLVRDVADAAPDMLARKRFAPQAMGSPAVPTDAPIPPWHNGPFMKACRHELARPTPIWLMRQAGRYLPEYRKIRSQVTFWDLCRNPQLCAEVMIQTVERLQVDAAILFADLLPILHPMGLDLEYAAGEGPVIHNPLREPADVDRVRELESTDPLHYVMDAVRITRAGLPPAVPLIGFAGAPFTLASYAIEGGSSRDYLRTKTFMYRDGGAWRSLMQRLTRAIVVYLNGQIAAGVQCVQLFDSWVGCLGPDDYRRYVLPAMRDVIRQITPGVPVIHFATGNPALLPLIAQSGARVIGVDWRVELNQAWQTIGHQLAIQGNLDPATLFSTPEEIRRRAEDILQQAGGRPGHIFNLGHGVLPHTPVHHVTGLIETVHELTS